MPLIKPRTSGRRATLALAVLAALAGLARGGAQDGQLPEQLFHERGLLPGFALSAGKAICHTNWRNGSKA